MAKDKVIRIHWDTFQNSKGKRWRAYQVKGEALHKIANPLCNSCALNEYCHQINRLLTPEEYADLIDAMEADSGCWPRREEPLSTTPSGS